MPHATLSSQKRPKSVLDTDNPYQVACLIDTNPWGGGCGASKGHSSRYHCTILPKLTQSLQTCGETTANFAVLASAFYLFCPNFAISQAIIMFDRSLQFFDVVFTNVFISHRFIILYRPILYRPTYLHVLDCSAVAVVYNAPCDEVVISCLESLESGAGFQLEFNLLSTDGQPTRRSEKTEMCEVSCLL